MPTRDQIAFGSLETARLLLEEPNFHHAPGIMSAFGADPDVTQFLRWRPNRDPSEGENAMAARLKRLSAEEEFSWIAVLREENAIAGTVALWPGPRGVEIGFAFAARFWGRGLAPEAAHAAMEWGIANLAPSRIWAACDVENTRSARVLEKLGMCRVRTAPRFAVHPNISDEPRDCHIYEVVVAAVQPALADERAER